MKKKQGNTVTNAERKAAERDKALSKCYEAYQTHLAEKSKEEFRCGLWWLDNCVEPVPDQPYPHPDHQRPTGDLQTPFIVPRSTFIRNFALMVEKEGKLPARVGHPFTFTPEQELEIIANINEAERSLGVLTAKQLQNEILGYAIKPLTAEEVRDAEVHAKGVYARLTRCGGDDFLSSFLARHNFDHATGKALEAYRAAKIQPEIFLEHFRNLFHACYRANASLCVRIRPGEPFRLRPQQAGDND
jgi:hypothetical protein